MAFLQGTIPTISRGVGLDLSAMQTCNFEEETMFCVLEMGHLDDHRFLFVIEGDEGTEFRMLTHKEYAEIAE
jgi:hypothetical protein